MASLAYRSNLPQEGWADEWEYETAQERVKRALEELDEIQKQHKTGNVPSSKVKAKIKPFEQFSVKCTSYSHKLAKGYGQSTVFVVKGVYDLGDSVRKKAHQILRSL